MSLNQITKRIHMSNGLFLYKTGRSPYYFVRVWNPIKKKYLTLSTKETTRIDARQSDYGCLGISTKFPAETKL